METNKTKVISPGEMSAFLERFRASLSHDLRTPLGTIVNYASMLENYKGSRADEVRNFGGRIRQKAMQTATMLQHLSTVARLVSANRHAQSGELSSLADKALGEVGGRGPVRTRGFEDCRELPIAPELLSFAWKTFLELDAQTNSSTPRDVTIGLSHDRVSNDCLLDLVVGSDPAATSAAPVDIATFLRSVGDDGQSETVLAMRLVADLVQLHGGTPEVLTHAGKGATLRMRFSPGG